ncbi:hypothetical protein FOA52_004947 [Chlamydomonas sp. UWO 241]|nr:hypothetical protein FOA52_004947 [Chlamydomonas sp. UWO 241]
MWQSCDAELVSMAEHFGNLVRAAHVPDEEADVGSAFGGKEKRSPGEMLEVWAERLVYSAHTAVHILSQLKKGALLGDVNALVSNVRAVRTAFERGEDSVSTQLTRMKGEVHDLLGQLEDSYYSSQHRGRVITASMSKELDALVQLAMSQRMEVKADAAV